MHGHQEILPHEDVQLPEPHPQRLWHEVQGVGDDEDVVLVLLQLGRVAQVAAVLDFQLVEAELLRQPVEHRRFRLLHVVPAQVRALVEKHRARLGGFRGGPGLCRSVHGNSSEAVYLLRFPGRALVVRRSEDGTVGGGVGSVSPTTELPSQFK